MASRSPPIRCTSRSRRSWITCAGPGRRSSASRRVTRRSKTCSSPSPEGACVTERSAQPRSALAELTLARFRLFFREPSALFWTFGFPVVLAVALGIAFRNRPPEAAHVAVEAGPGAERTLAALVSAEVRATVEDAGKARAKLRAGKGRV